MNEGLIPSRYAKALYKFAVEKNVASPLYDVMRTLESSFSGSNGETFRNVVANPYVSAESKREIIETAAGLKNEQGAVNDVFKDFITLLFNNNRISELRGIVLAYDSLYRKENGISRVHVTWASEPTQEGEERLKEMISKKLDEGTMEYSSSVDPSLIGGFRIAIDNEQLDASVENELRQLRQQLLRK